LVILGLTIFFTQQTLIVIALITASVITLFFYTKLVYSSLMVNKLINFINLIIPQKWPTLPSFILILSTLGNLVTVPLVLLVF
jgi:hypothetical protein